VSVQLSGQLNICTFLVERRTDTTISPGHIGCQFFFHAKYDLTPIVCGSKERGVPLEPICRLCISSKWLVFNLFKRPLLAGFERPLTADIERSTRRIRFRTPSVWSDDFGRELRLPKTAAPRQPVGDKCQATLMLHSPCLRNRETQGQLESVRPVNTVLEGRAGRAQVVPSLTGGQDAPD
jgi:hypothetical protein